MADEKQDNAEVQPGPQKIGLKGFGAAIDLENVSLNTFFTLVGFLLIVLIAWAIVEHRDDSKYHGKEFLGAIKEVVQEQKVMTQAIRESNCLVSLSPEERKRDAEFCKRVSR